MTNEGYSPAAIKTVRQKAKEEGKNFIINDAIERTSESVCFYFVGKHEGKEVVFDACLFALRIEYEMAVFGLAEERVSDTYPDFDLEEEIQDEDSEAMELFDEKVAEIEENQEVSVQEYVEFDETVDYGVGIDICLKVKEVTDKVISDFVEEFNAGTFETDDKEYIFSLEQLGDE